MFHLEGEAMPTIEEFAYLAGLVDSEGSVTLLNPGKNKYRVPVISMASTDKEIIDYIHGLFGGTTCGSKPRNGNKPQWCWRINQGSALSLLENIIPFLQHTEKKRRTSLLLTKYKALTITPVRAYSANDHKQRKDFEREFFTDSNGNLSTRVTLT